MSANRQQAVRNSASFAEAQALALQSLRQRAPDRDRQGFTCQFGDLAGQAVSLFILETQGHRSVFF